MNESLLQQLKLMWGAIYRDKQHNATKVDTELERLTVLKFVEANKTFACIFNLTDFNIEYATPNCQEVLGFQVELNSPEFFEHLLRSFAPEHLQEIYEMTEKIKLLAPDLRNESGIESLTFSVCGVKYIHPERGNIRLLNRNVVLEFNEQNQPIKVLRIFQDISHLVKNDLFCLRMEIIGRKITFLMSKRSDTKEYLKQDLLSEREKEILELIAQGKDTDEIAKILFISKVTINNHRQNMLNKIGAKDTTALVQLAKFINII